MFAHKVLAKDRFGHRVFHLKTGVHFDEIELALFIEELDGASACVFDAGNRIGTGFTNGCAFFRCDAGAGGLFEYFLVAALQGTVTFAQMDRVAFAIAEHLNFDVARRGQVLFDVNFVVAKVRLAFGTRCIERLFHFSRVFRNLHTTTTATGSGFDDHGIADLFTDLQGRFQIRHTTVRAGNARHAQFFHGVFGGDLVAHDADVFGAGADKRQVVIFDDLYELRVFRQEAISGVDGLRTGYFAGCDDRGDRQIAVGGLRRADADGFIGHTHVHRIAVGSRVHRDGFDTHLAARTDDAKRNFTTVGD